MTLLFQISLFHGYFASGLFETCTLAPDAASARFIGRHALQLRTSAGRLGVYACANKPSLTTLAYWRDRLDGGALRFVMQGSAGRFGQITATRLDAASQVCLTTSVSVPQAATSGGMVVSQLQQAPGAHPGARDGVLGTVEVRLDDCIAIGGQDIDFQASFAARRLHWLYYVINRGQRKLHQPAVRNRHDTFEAPQALVLPNGEAALSFSSGALSFPLQQRPTTPFDLVDHIQSGSLADEPAIEHCVVKGLPVPDGNNLNAQQVDGSLVVFGEMYVYL